jgi:hypothetical protein
MTMAETKDLAARHVTDLAEARTATLVAAFGLIEYGSRFPSCSRL